MKTPTSRSLRLFVFQLVQLSLPDLFILFTILSLQNKKQFSIEQLLIKPFEEADDKEDHSHQKENAENRNEVECNCVLLL